MIWSLFNYLLETVHDLNLRIPHTPEYLRVRKIKRALLESDFCHLMVVICLYCILFLKKFIWASQLSNSSFPSPPLHSNDCLPDNKGQATKPVNTFHVSLLDYSGILGLCQHSLLFSDKAWTWQTVSDFSFCSYLFCVWTCSGGVSS